MTEIAAHLSKKEIMDAIRQQVEDVCAEVLRRQKERDKMTAEHEVYDGVDRERANRIAALNDAMRTSIEPPMAPNMIVFTGALAESDEEIRILALNGARQFKDFTLENDPWGERDFMRYTIGQNTFIAKIDYYTPDLEAGSDDPDDPEKTARVMSIFYAEDL